MERDYEYSSRLHFADLDAPERDRPQGRRAGRQAGSTRARRRPAGSTVIFDPRVARGIAGHLAGAINGAAVARKTSFLRDRMGRQVADSRITVTDDPLRVRGQSSRPFDGEGVEGEPLGMVEEGVLKHWFLSTSAARELGLETNGRGVRGGIFGLAVLDQSRDRARREDAGGADPRRSTPASTSPKCSARASTWSPANTAAAPSGFWIENGELAYPVSEVTIASNLKDMFWRSIPGQRPRPQFRHGGADAADRRA